MPNKVLVVEDYEDSRRLYKKMLENIGFDVIEASDGYEAVEQFNQEQPDHILMDMALPGMDGVAATRHIKDIAETSNIPIIGITAHGNFYNVRGVQAGCDAMVTKPIDLNKLTSIISLYVQ